VNIIVSDLVHMYLPTKYECRVPSRRGGASASALEDQDYASAVAPAQIELSARLDSADDRFGVWAEQHGSWRRNGRQQTIRESDVADSLGNYAEPTARRIVWATPLDSCGFLWSVSERTFNALRDRLGSAPRRGRPDGD
jgi:hypothetical protein